MIICQLLIWLAFVDIVHWIMSSSRIGEKITTEWCKSPFWSEQMASQWSLDVAGIKDSSRRSIEAICRHDCIDDHRVVCVDKSAVRKLSNRSQKRDDRLVNFAKRSCLLLNGRLDVWWAQHLANAIWQLQHAQTFAFNVRDAYWRLARKHRKTIWCWFSDRIPSDSIRRAMLITLS